MLSERERRQFDEIVRTLRDDNLPDASEPAPRVPAAVAATPQSGRWRRVVTWAEHRFEQRLERRDTIIARSNRGH